MNMLPQYFVGYVPEVKALLAIRADASERVGSDLQELLGGSIPQFNFNVVSTIHFLTRQGNAFGRALWVYEQGQPKQITADTAEYAHMYALLSVVTAELVKVQLEKQFWTRVYLMKLAERDDLANMLQLAGLIK